MTQAGSAERGAVRNRHCQPAGTICHCEQLCVGSPCSRAHPCPVGFEGTDFEDTDYGQTRPAPGGRAPSREELDAQLTGTQQQLAKLRETQEQLERARAALEEMRRRRTEFTRGLAAMRQQLTRGVGLLEKAELDARRQAEQLARTLDGLRAANGTLEPLSDKAWTDENWEQELTRALTVIENARMEFNGARLKWPVLDGKTTPVTADEKSVNETASLADLPLGRLLKLGLALTWPLAVAVLLVGVLVYVFRH